MEPPSAASSIPRVDWDASHLAVARLASRFDRTPYALALRAWAVPRDIVDHHGAPIARHHYGHVMRRIPREKPLDGELAQRDGDAMRVRDEIRSRLTLYLTDVARHNGCSFGRSTQTAAWWRLDADDSPTRSTFVSKHILSAEARAAEQQLRALSVVAFQPSASSSPGGIDGSDVYDLSSHDKAHSLQEVLRDAPAEDKAALKHALDLLVVSKRDAMALVARQVGNRDVVDMLLQKPRRRKERVGGKEEQEEDM
jgi:hypothetical protein